MANNDLVPAFDDEQNSSLKLALDKIEGSGNAVLISLTGYIKEDSIAFFQRQIDKVFSCGFINIVFDCGALDYISSSGMAVFASIKKTAEGRNGGIVFANIKREVFEVFQLLAFSEYFTVAPSLEEALSRFNGKAPKKQIFPLTFNCPACSKQLTAPKSGRFRCPSCRSVITFLEDASVALG